VARELTKLYEEVRRAPLDQLAAHYVEAGPPKGEVVVVIGPPAEAPPASIEDVDALLREALDNASARDAAASVAAATGLPKREVYARAIILAKGR
jgi:16S rRNA (cytidine1402-2'-O)-methyltransferase